MPSLTRPPVPHYAVPTVTREELDYADLPIIDLSKAATTEGRAELAIQVCKALTSQGFFYVINHGYTPAQTERAFDIANVPFAQVSDEEKQQPEYMSRIKETGSHQGYKLRQYWHIDNGIRDQIETYNMNRNVNKRQHPEAIRPLLPEISDFMKHCHFDVLYQILRLMALGLELPEETLVNLHDYHAEAETYVRFMKYYPRSEEDEAKTKGVWLKGHTDIGTVTLLYSQPVSALQVLGTDERWRWVKHIDNAIIVNVGDGIEFLSGGYYRATVHRVVQPPKDQRDLTRLSIVYFCMANDDVKLAPLMDSPVLQRLGVNPYGRFGSDADVPTMEMWRKARTSSYGQAELKASEKDTGVEEEVVNGVVVKHYR